jgi:hypothetical protein
MPLHVAILCPGPSLSSTYPGRDGYNVVIGVNRAATAFLCDLWAALDVQMIVDNAGKVLGAPLLLSTADTIGTIPAHGVHWPRSLQQDKYLDAIPYLLGWSPDSIGWTSLSCTSAIAYAVSIHATAIDLYGADWAGTLDFDGMAAGENRAEPRWAMEKRLVMGYIAPWLVEHGITFRRIQPQTPAMP